MDVNDNSPVFSKSSYLVDVSEDAEQGSQVLEVSRNKYYGDSKYVFVFFRHLTYSFFNFQVTATDADDELNGRVLYFLSREAHGAFTVDDKTGRITTSAPLDREKRASYSFQVFAVDLSPAAPRNTSAQASEGIKVFSLLQ